MKIYGGIYYFEDGISTSLRGMNLQTALLSNVTENVNNFNKVGYQRKAPVVSSFAEYIGPQALSEVTDPKTGRISQTENPLDFALSKEGYFQVKTPQGIKLTRDGRFKLDKDGYLLTLENNKVMGRDGSVIRFKPSPQKLQDVKVDKEGNISCLDPVKNVQYSVGQLSVVSNKGSYVKDIEVRQGYTEDSNVDLQKEFFALVPVRRNYEANRQLYIIQNDELSRVIQELGRSS